MSILSSLSSSQLLTLFLAVFWAVLAIGAFSTTFTTWSNISEHALNSVLAFLEILLPRSEPHPWINIAPLIGILALYLGLAYLTHDTEGIYVYTFLDPATGRGLVAAYCIGILLATIIVFVIVRCIQLLRGWLTETKLRSGTPRVDSSQSSYEQEVGVATVKAHN